MGCLRLLECRGFSDLDEGWVMALQCPRARDCQLWIVISCTTENSPILPPSMRDGPNTCPPQYSSPLSIGSNLTFYGKLLLRDPPPILKRQYTSFRPTPLHQPIHTAAASCHPPALKHTPKLHPWSCGQRGSATLSPSPFGFLIHLSSPKWYCKLTNRLNSRDRIG